jgi:hypothetical protein
MPIEGLKHELHRLRWSLLIRGLIAVTLGILIIVKPLDSIAALLSRALDRLCGVARESLASSLRHRSALGCLPAPADRASVGLGAGRGHRQHLGRHRGPRGSTAHARGHPELHRRVRSHQRNHASHRSLPDGFDGARGGTGLNAILIRRCSATGRGRRRRRDPAPGNPR